MTDGRRRWPVVAIVAAALALRLYGLGHESFWIDEVFQRDIAAQPLGKIVADYRPHPEVRTGLRDQAPLSHLLFHFFVGDARGGSEARARLPSAIAGALGAGVLYLLALDLVPPAVAGLAALLLVLSPLDLWYSQECRFYELWTLIATASYWALVRALAGGRGGWWIAYAILTAAGLYTCIMHALVIVAQMVTMAWHGTRTRRLRAVAGVGVAALAAAALAALPVVWLVLGERGRDAGTPRPPSFFALPYTLFTFAAGFSLGPTVESLHVARSPLAIAAAHPSVPIVGALFALVTAAGLARVRRWPLAASVLVPWLLLPPLGVLALSFGTRVVYNVRYVLASLGAFLVIVAAGCLAPRRDGVRRLAVAAVLACTLVALGGFYWSPRYDKAQAREAMAHIRVAGVPARIVVVGQIWRVIDYYTRGTPVTLTGDCDPTALATPEGTTAWVVAGRDWDAAAPACLARLDASHRIAEHRAFVGLELWRLAPRPPRP
jgi:mannosyltransferase